MRFVLALLALNALLVLAFATFGSLRPVGNELAQVNSSLPFNGNVGHLSHNKPRFSDRNFDYDSLADAETENADKLKKENKPLLHEPSENEEEVQPEIEQIYLNENELENEAQTNNTGEVKEGESREIILPNAGVSSRRRKKDFGEPVDRIKGKQTENSKGLDDGNEWQWYHGNDHNKITEYYKGNGIEEKEVNKNSEVVPVRRKKQLSKAKVTPNIIMKLIVVFMFAVVNPLNLFMIYPAMKTINNHHQPERTILSLDTLTKCEPSKDNPNQKRCTIEMHDTNYENAFEIYAKAPNDDNHLSLVTKINPNECKLGKNVFVEPGQVRAECKKDAGLIDLNKLETKIKLNSEEAERVKKYQTESIIRRSLLDPENEYHQRNKEDIESLQITNQNIRFFQHPSFYELHKKRRQLSEERLKSYDPNIQSSNLRRTKSQNDINPLEEKNRHLSEKHLHVYSHNVPTLNLQSSKSEDINSWKEIHRHLTEEPKTQTFNLKRSNLYEWRDFKHGDNFKGVESFETDETIN